MPTISPAFSILIPAVPSRLPRLQALMNHLEMQITMSGAQEQVEVLALLDNKKRSVGLKRQALLGVARGRWLAFVDDDDQVSDSYVSKIIEAIATAEANLAVETIDVITFDTWAVINDAPHVLVTHGNDLANEEYKLAGFTRKPWHVHVWARSLARTSKFQDASYGEDAAWLRPFWGIHLHEYKIQGPPLYTYRFSSQGTEAELTFPKPVAMPNTLRHPL